MVDRRDYTSILSNGMVPDRTSNFLLLRNISLNFVFYRARQNVPFGYEGESDWLPRAVLAWLAAFPLTRPGGTFRESYPFITSAEIKYLLSLRIEEVFPAGELLGGSVPDFALTGTYIAWPGPVELSDPKSWLSDPKSWLSDPKSWLSDPKSWLSDPKSWLSDPKSWLSDVDNARARISMRDEFKQKRRSFSGSEDGWKLAGALEKTFSNREGYFFEWCHGAGITAKQANNILSAQALFAIDFAMHNVWRENEIFASSVPSSREVGWQPTVEIFDNFTWIWPFCW